MIHKCKPLIAYYYQDVYLGVGVYLMCVCVCVCVCVYLVCVMCI